MPLATNANATYGVSTIREDLQEALTMISPTETPFMSAIGTKSIDNTLYEWPVVTLASPNGSNRVLEGENAPSNDVPTNAVRLQNYAQISDKVVEVTTTANAVNGVGDVQTLAKQVALKLKELKRDMETMLLANVAANPGSNTVARATAGLPAFMRTNVSRGSGGANPTLSGTSAGYPNAAATDGTLRALTETLLNSVIRSCWDAGAEPSIIMCGGLVKQKISSSFTGSATRYRDISDKKIVAAVDLYVSDFGDLQVVPNRFQRARDVFILDPKYARVAYLQKTSQKELARTGHSERRLIANEYGLQVDTEAAHGIVADINGAL
jgi:hypothetical protein